MSSETRSVATALEDVARWKAEEEKRQVAELAQVDEEVKSLEASVASLKEQLVALARFRQELVEKGAALATTELEKSYTALFDALGSQASALSGRATAVTEARDQHQATLSKSLEDPEIAAIVKDVEAFDAAAVEALPESYRAPVLAHHEAQRKKLDEFLKKKGGTKAKLELAELRSDLVFAVDAPEDEPELLIVVTPVSAEVHTEWATRKEDVQTHVAARIIQGVYEACRQCGLGSAQALLGGHRGLLALEIELVGASSEIDVKLLERLSAVLGSAPELREASVKVQATKVPVDYLIPPEEDEEEAEEEEVAHAG